MTAIVPRQTVREMVASYEAACLAVRQGFARIRATQFELELRFRSVSCLKSHRPLSFGDSEAELIVKNMTKDCWRDLFAQLNLEKFVSLAEMERLEREREAGTLPPLTDEAVMSMMASFLERLPELLDAQIAEVFEWFRPNQYGEKLKTNRQWRIAEKVIVQHAVQRDKWDGKFSVGWWGNASVRLQALENVCNGILGLPRSDAHKSELERAIKLSPEGETSLFRYRACANGNLHLWFKDSKIPAELNRRGAGRELRGAA